MGLGFCQSRACNVVNLDFANQVSVDPDAIRKLVRGNDLEPLCDLLRQMKAEHSAILITKKNVSKKVD